MGKEGAVGIILEYGAGAHADDGWLRCAEAMRHSWGRAWPLAVFDRFEHEKVLFSEFSQKCLMFFAKCCGIFATFTPPYYRRWSRGKLKEKWL